MFLDADFTFVFMHASRFVCFDSSHALTSDVSIEETARAAEFFLSDGVIITGAATGMQANPEEFRGAAHLTQTWVTARGAQVEPSWKRYPLSPLGGAVVCYKSTVFSQRCSGLFFITIFTDRHDKYCWFIQIIFN